MDDSQDRPDYFQYRWGVKEWDVGFTTIPNPVLKHYSRVPWVDKDGKRGRGISNQEMLCIVHLASFHYESEEGESRPAIGTVARRMGYRKDDSVRGLVKSLEHKNLLMVERRPGKCSVYNLLNFSRAILELEGEQPPHPNGDHSDGGLFNGDHSQGDEEKKVLEERKQEGKEEKEKKSVSNFPENPAPPAPSPGGGADSGKEIDHAADTLQDMGTDGIRQAQPAEAADYQSTPRPVLRSRASGQDVVPSADGGDDYGPAAQVATADPLRFDLHRATAAARAGAGGNWADPGEDGAGVAEVALTRFCEMQGEAPTDDECESMLRELTETLKPLRATVEEIDAAFDIMVKDFGYRVGNYNVFQDSFKRDLATCIRRARGKKQPAQPDRAARYDTPAVRASQAAFEERKAARDPPVEDDRIGAAIKDQLHAQMTRPTYDTYIGPTCFICDDGILVVTAPTAFVKDWLENRLGPTIKRRLNDFADGPQEVRFEVQPEEVE